MLYFVMIPVARKIYSLRRKRGMTQKELALSVGIPQPNLSNIEKGKQDITVTTLQKFAYALGVSAGSFFEDDRVSKKKSWSRARIECLAKAIVHSNVKVSPEDKEIRDLFVKILPAGERKRRREVIDAWLKLRIILSGEEIRQIHARVRDERLR